MKQIFIKIKAFFLANESKIVLIIGFCLVAAVSYEFGVLQGQKWQQEPLVIEKPSDTRQGQETANQGNLETPAAIKTAVASKIGAAAPTTPNTTGCVYVGSKNSDKFYLPTCSYAKRVKPENLVCFKSATEATGQGRTESKCK